jgi:hypothetical protein
MSTTTITVGGFTITYTDPPVVINNNSPSFSHTFSGTNRFGALFAGGKGASFIGPPGSTFFTGATIGGAACVKKGEVTRVNDPNVAAYLFTKVAPASGSQTCVLTSSGAGFNGWVMALAVDHIHQSTPFWPQLSDDVDTWQIDINQTNSQFDRDVAFTPGGLSFDMVFGYNAGNTPTPHNGASALMTIGDWPGRAMASVRLNANQMGWDCFNGTSLFSGLSFSLVPDGVTTARAPGAPTMYGAFAGNAELTVTGAPPDDHGDSAIDNYRATLSPGGATFTSTKLPIRCASGIVNGTTYTATLAAHNTTFGWGAESTVSNAVTPNVGVPRRSSGIRF